jgi:hypothetical protein
MQVEERIVRQLKARIAIEVEERGDGSLPEESLLHEKIQGLKSVPPFYATNFLYCTEREFQNVDWDVVTRRLKEEVMVRYDQGSGIVDDSETYDKSWFSNLKLEKGAEFYYLNRFSEYYAERLGPQVRYTIGQDTQSILDLCGAPDRKESRHIRGLIFGFVQSGKTINYLSVANAAMDSGYDMIVILAGATNILRRQTQERLNRDLIGQLSGKIAGVGEISFKDEKKPISLTTLKSDFNSNVARAQMSGFTLHTTKTPVVAVLKKNVSPLKNLKKWLVQQAGGGRLEKSILLIDDESDYASVNTKEENDPTSINKGIREILNVFSVSTYLAVTATPFANILIDHESNNEEQGSDLFPRSFIWALDRPETYVGVRETLGDGFVDVTAIPGYNSKMLESEVKGLLFAKKDEEHQELPILIQNAACRFFYDATCLRRARPETDHLSMLVNVSRFTDHHIRLGALLSEFVEKLFKQIRTSSMEKISDPWLVRIREMAEEDFGEFRNLQEFWSALEDSLSISQVYDIHQKSKIELTYPKGVVRNSLLVGGLTLSRGYTVEGLITSAFVRTTRTFDALMQMGRWFGHKKHIAQYITVHTIPEIQHRFDVIEDSIIDLLEQIKEMKDAKQAPKDFGLNIKRHPNVTIERTINNLMRNQGLEVVARNKQKAASLIELKLSLSNRCMETVRLLQDRDIIAENDRLVTNFWRSLEADDDSVEYRHKSNSHLHVDGASPESALGFLDVPHELIRDFLLKFKLPKQTLSDTTSKLPLRFLEEYLKDRERLSTKWDVSIVSSSKAVESDVFDFCGHSLGKVTRSFEKARDGESIKIPKNQLSIPSNEFRFLPIQEVQDLDLKNRTTARTLRKMNGNKPLLLLFPIAPGVAKDVKDLDLEGLKGVNLWGWTISMPGTKEDEERVVVLANTVYQKEFEELLDYDFGNEDLDEDD